MKSLFLVVFVLALVGCDIEERQAKSSGGISKATASVTTQANGLTVEQENIKRRIEMENLPGTMKHLYVISAMSGDIILYSSVRGKVTSSGKRLTPTSVNVQDGEFVNDMHGGFDVGFPGYGNRRTGEVLQDDGTYGSSIEYLYWWDTQDKYHQHYVSGGQIVHISDAPIGARKAIINLDAMK